MFKHNVLLINTHCHIDHILGNEFIMETWRLNINIHIQELPMLQNSLAIAKIYGLKFIFLGNSKMVKLGRNLFTESKIGI